jgi:hypothetical protein
MTKKDSEIKCRLTGPGGELLWAGTTGQLKQLARRMKARDKRRAVNEAKLGYSTDSLKPGEAEQLRSVYAALRDGEKL